MRAFDLNIERILEHWKPQHAVRELIANALDETLISGCAPPEIRKDGKHWLIRDFGRGLRYEHLTQNVSDEKKKHKGVIGYFGIGLKDAFGALNRAGVAVQIASPHGVMTVRSLAKHGFADIKTLHAEIEAAPSSMAGTEVRLSGIADSEVKAAREMFLVFNGDAELEATRYGRVLRRGADEDASIYVNGLRVAREPDFLFSYDITSLTEAMRRALNRERANVGRQAYTGRVKEILLAAETPEVGAQLAERLQEFEERGLEGELQWIDVQEHAVALLNPAGTSVFLTPEEIALNPRFVDEARRGRNKIVTIPENLRDRIAGQTDVRGNTIRDLDAFVDEYKRSFQYEFVAPTALNAAERAIFERWPNLVALVGVDPKLIAEVTVSAKMRVEDITERDALGVWESGKRRIIIRRDQLARMSDFAATFLHEVAHAASDAEDISLDFEDKLTEFLGIVASKPREVAPGLARTLQDRVMKSLRKKASPDTANRIVKPRRR